MYIDKKEALRYMGYRGQKPDSGMEKLLDVCIAELCDIIKKGFVYDIYDIERTEEGLCLKGTTLVLHGEAIEAHLSRSGKCALLAVTLGLEVDKRVAFYSRMDLTKGLVFDACATAAVEALCDEAQGEIAAAAAAMELQATSRYSPGYGDFDIGIQSQLVKVLKAYERIGISVNESSIMIPRKSVTAIIGLQKEKCTSEGLKCKSCNDRYCLYRKDGNEDGYKA